MVQISLVFGVYNIGLFYFASICTAPLFIEINQCLSKLEVSVPSYILPRGNETTEHVLKYSVCHMIKPST